MAGILVWTNPQVKPFRPQATDRDTSRADEE